MVTGSDGSPAVDCRGVLKSTSISYWSDTIDGTQVTAGGAGGRLLKSIEAIDFSENRFYDFRQIYTCKDPSVSKELVRFYRDNDPGAHGTISPLDLGIADGDAKEKLLERDRIINYLYGYTYDAADSGGKVYDHAKDGAPTKTRKWNQRANHS